jgi:hypothetical protein
MSPEKRGERRSVNRKHDEKSDDDGNKARNWLKTGISRELAGASGRESQKNLSKSSMDIEDIQFEKMRQRNKVEIQINSPREPTNCQQGV